MQKREPALVSNFDPACAIGELQTESETLRDEALPIAIGQPLPSNRRYRARGSALWRRRAGRRFGVLHRLSAA